MAKNWGTTFVVQSVGGRRRSTPAARRRSSEELDAQKAAQLELEKADRRAAAEARLEARRWVHALP